MPFETAYSFCFIRDLFCLSSIKTYDMDLIFTSTISQKRNPFSIGRPGRPRTTSFGVFVS